MYIYLGKNKEIQRLMTKASEMEQLFFKYFRELLNGLIELKLNRRKQTDLLENHLKKSSAGNNRHYG